MAPEGSTGEMDPNSRLVPWNRHRPRGRNGIKALLDTRQTTPLSNPIIQDIHSMGKHFFNKRLNAFNALEIKFDSSILLPLIQIASNNIGEDYHTLNPRWPSNILWISNNNKKSYNLFLKIFNELGVEAVMKNFISHRETIVMYNGFYVTRSKCSATNFHTDWPDGNNDGFTLITPLIHPPGNPDLAYLDKDSNQRTYKYEMGKAINFGSNFIHSTEIGHSDAPSVLLSMTYGTDMMELWEPNYQIVDPNSLFYRLPNGAFVDKNNK
ncbi:hypothetical protein [Prochlorococcus sp. MIT 1303]|uniref:hypothetical protein n=1 Tax=Prochlorococcus sp. MIT 1303 TaxID=1723647 RepID=UPI0007BB0318|nr:hypothetical protein [Prochlorococcus sp. MIT 1303]KZR67591.1 hypothetical protein PMIT1303_00501 [Prochlorococcus sp. MIT 1303]